MKEIYHYLYSRERDREREKKKQMNFKLSQMITNSFIEYL